MIYSTLHPFRLDTRFTQMIPDLNCELGCVLVRPVIFVDEWLGVMEVVDKIMLSNNTM